LKEIIEALLLTVSIIGIMKRYILLLCLLVLGYHFFAQETDSIPQSYPQVFPCDTNGLMLIEISDGVVIEMQKVADGAFPMGSKNGYPNELPVHKVTLDAYFIGKFEVTQKVWFAVMNNNPAHFSDCIECPVEMVTYNVVLEFIEKLNTITGLQFRLPTEAEWEFAANGGNEGKRTRYAGSYKIDEVAWYERTAENRTHPVGEKLPNELGIYDMSGNVYEWTQDWFKRYKGKDQVNPVGPEKGKNKVIRGGCWHDDRDGCRVQCRVEMPPDDRNGCLGFRLAMCPVK
jgi:formylglycine-generating enzyme required for sulfatase activity